MAFSTAGRGLLKAEMNVTPMIDVLLVLIIVFMVVVASISRSQGLEAQIPQPAKIENSASPRTVVIQLAWTGEDNPPSLKINEETVPWDDLQSRLSRIFLQRAERVAFVKGDDDIDYRSVAEAISIAKSSGVERVGLLSRTSMDPAQ